MRTPVPSLLALLALLTSCGQLLDVDEYTATSTATLPLTCGSLPYSGVDCGGCMETSCCSEAAACAGDEVCRKTQECYAGCREGDMDCRGVCNGAIPYEVPAERALERCLATHCSMPCEAACGGSLPLERGRRFRGQPGCCDAEKLLWTNPAAYGWQQCQSGCFLPQADRVPGANDCDCVSLNPGSEGPALQLAQCADAVRKQVAPDWSCVGKVDWPGTQDSELELRLKMIRLLSVVPVQDVTLTACGGYESACGDPLSAPATTDVNGLATLKLAQRLATSSDFYTYLQLVGPSIPDTLFYFSAPAPIRQSRREARSLLTRETVTSIYGAAKVAPDGASGSIGVQVWDCNPTPAAGVRIESRPPAQIIYSRGDIPDPSATTTGTNGQAMLLNVPAGPVDLTFTLAETNQVVAELRVWVRPGALTIAVSSPTPSR